MSGEKGVELLMKYNLDSILTIGWHPWINNGCDRIVVPGYIVETIILIVWNDEWMIRLFTRHRESFEKKREEQVMWTNACLLFFQIL